MCEALKSDNHIIKMGSAQEEGSYLFSFGLISDVQYADIDDGLNYAKTCTRYYRTSLDCLRSAVSHWEEDSRVSFVLQLGDIIDGFNRRDNNSQVAMETVMEAFESFSKPVYHQIGNHELYNFTRTEVLKSKLFEDLKPELENCACYHFSPFKGFRFIGMDQYDFSMLGYDSDCEVFCEAREFLTARNPNSDLNSPTGLRGTNKRFVKFNGGVSERQLQWLDKLLTQADEAGEKVVVFGHLPVYEMSGDIMCLCWNHEEVMKTLHQHQCVVAYLCGHDHAGGAAIDGRAIQHITFPGVIEAPPGVPCYATAHVYKTKIEIIGEGNVQSYTITL